MTARNTFRTTIDKTALLIPVEDGEPVNAILIGDFTDHHTGEPYRLWTLPEDDQ